jgi:hypothetical protein
MILKWWQVDEVYTQFREAYILPVLVRQNTDEYLQWRDTWYFLEPVMNISIFRHNILDLIYP